MVDGIRKLCSGSGRGDSWWAEIGGRGEKYPQSGICSPHQTSFARRDLYQVQ